MYFEWIWNFPEVFELFILKNLRGYERRRAEHSGGLRNGQGQESKATSLNTKDQSVPEQHANQLDHAFSPLMPSTDLRCYRALI